MIKSIRWKNTSEGVGDPYPGFFTYIIEDTDFIEGEFEVKQFIGNGWLLIESTIAIINLYKSKEYSINDVGKTLGSAFLLLQEKHGEIASDEMLFLVDRELLNLVPDYEPYKVSRDRFLEKAQLLK